MYLVVVNFAGGKKENFTPSSTTVEEIIKEVKMYYENKVDVKYDKDLGRHIYSYYIITDIQITDKQQYDKFYTDTYK